VPDGRPGLTETVNVVEPFAGTVTDAGKLTRLSPEVVVPASKGTRIGLVLGVNFSAASKNVWPAPAVFDNVNGNDAGTLFEELTLPKLAESGAKKIVAFAALLRFSRPAPCAVGPTSFVPVFAS